MAPSPRRLMGVFALGVLVVAVGIQLAARSRMQIAVQLYGFPEFASIVWAAVLETLRGTKASTPSRVAWYDLVNAMVEFDESYVSARRGIHRDEEVAEGHLFGLHLLAAGLDAFVLDQDPEKPRFKNLFNPGRKYLVDQPDAVYLLCPVLDSASQYRIRGVRDSQVKYLSVTVYVHKLAAGNSDGIVSEAAFPESSLSGVNIRDSFFALRLAVDEPSDLEPRRALAQNARKGRPGPGLGPDPLVL